MKIIADDKIPFLKGALEPFAEMIYMPGNQIDARMVSDADALLIRTRTKCTEQLLNDSKVKFIGTATIGFDHIDKRFCSKKKITWTNAPGCNSSSVQQYVAAALLKISSEFRIDLKGKTLGIVGVGNVGSKVEKFARQIGMNVLLNDPPRARNEGDNGFVSLNTILFESDFITVHVPLKVVGEDKTWHMFNSRSFKKMKKGTWFINSSRGEVVDTSSLKKVLVSGKLGGAVIDVWEHEPDIDLELMALTFLSTPHIAGYSTDGKALGTSMVVNSLSDYFGLPLKKWHPSELPAVDKPVILISGKGKSDLDIVREAVLHTYNIDEDNIKLRFAPSDFETQRGDYPVRREFPAYSVKLTDCSKNQAELLKAIGFKVL